MLSQNDDGVVLEIGRTNMASVLDADDLGLEFAGRYQGFPVA